MTKVRFVMAGMLVGCGGSPVGADAGAACLDYTNAATGCFESVYAAGTNDYGLEQQLFTLQGACAQAENLSGEAADASAAYFDCLTTEYLRSPCLTESDLTDILTEVSSRCSVAPE